MYTVASDSTSTTTSGTGGFTFSTSQATTGTVTFANNSYTMSTNPPNCGASVTWAANAVASHTYAVVTVDSLSVSAGDLVACSPCLTYLVAYCPGSYVRVTATPSPEIADKFLPSDWSMSGGIATTNTDGTPSRTVELVDMGTAANTTITVTSGNSTQSVAVIVYQAIVGVYADKGNRIIGDFGHAWWSLSITPTIMYAYLQGVNPDNNQPISLAGIGTTANSLTPGPQGTAGFYDSGHPIGPGQVIFANPQPIQSNGGTHTTTGSYTWNVSLSSYNNALQAVYDLADHNDTPQYIVAGPMHFNCVDAAKGVAQAAGVTIGYNGFVPAGLSKWLNEQ